MPQRPFRFDPDKGLEVLLYIANRIAKRDIYWVLKTPYFADKHHVSEIGRPICGDHYIAMSKGPVPSGLYDIVKDVRDKRRLSAFVKKASEAFEIRGHEFVPKRDAELDYLSGSDREALDRAMREIEHLSFAELKARSHTPDYK